VDNNHVDRCRVSADCSSPAIFVRTDVTHGRLPRRELDHRHPFRWPDPLDCFEVASPYEKATAMRIDGCGGQKLITFKYFCVCDMDFGNDVCRHNDFLLCRKSPRCIGQAARLSRRSTRRCGLDQRRGVQSSVSYTLHHRSAPANPATRFMPSISNAVSMA